MQNEKKINEFDDLGELFDYIILYSISNSEINKFLIDEINSIIEIMTKI